MGSFAMQAAPPKQEKFEPITGKVKPVAKLHHTNVDVCGGKEMSFIRLMHAFLNFFLISSLRPNNPL